MNRVYAIIRQDGLYGQQYNLTLAYLRFIIPVPLAIIVLLFADLKLPYIIPLSVYLFFALIALIHTKKNPESFVSGNAFLVLDISLVFWACYATGLQTTALLTMFAVLVVIYTLHRGWLVGLVVLVSISLAYAAMLVMEARGFIPVAPMIVRPSLDYSMPGGKLAGWLITATAVFISYFFIARFVILLKKQQQLAFSTLAKSNEALRKELEMEQQLLTSQRLEGLGRLAGGVAHEFNNLLTVMLGYGRLAFDEMQMGSDDALDMQEVIIAAKRGKRLVEQLLYFSRSPQSEPEVLSPVDLVQHSLPMLKRFLKNNIRLEKSFSDLNEMIQVDKMLMEQVLVNLVNNAVDAMEDGGTLTIAVYPVSAGDLTWSEPLQESDTGRQSHVCIEVRDEGIGMDEQEKSAAEKPFYTTKDDEGTGLGLFMVREAVEQHGGIFRVDSAKGLGTSAKIYLPTKEPGKSLSPEDEKKKLPSGQEKILLVEDEEMVREFAMRALSRAGYTVLIAEDAESAKKAYESDEFSMLLTDVVLPGKSGYEFAEEIWKKDPSFKVLLMSGYSADTMKRLGIDISEINLLKKPFSLHALLERVRETLDTDR